MINFYKCINGDAVVMEMSGDLCKVEGVEQLKPNSTDAAGEKHVPVVTVEDGLVVVRVGSVPHPMLEEHYIEWECIKTSYGANYCKLNPGDEPEVKFPIQPDEVEEVYAYCNLHGLWKAKEPVLGLSFASPEVACSPEFTEGCVDPAE